MANLVANVNELEKKNLLIFLPYIGPMKFIDWTVLGLVAKLNSVYIPYLYGRRTSYQKKIFTFWFLVWLVSYAMTHWKNPQNLEYKQILHFG